MKRCNLFFLLMSGVVLLSVNNTASSQAKGLKTITEKELHYHLGFLGAREFRGRETPSAELEIATLYIGNWAKYNGLKPLMKDGSYYQEVPVKVTAVSEAKTRMKIVKGNNESLWYFGKSFGGNFTSGGTYSGTVLFAGTGYDEIKNIDLRGKIVVIIDEQKPET
ncbi:MAG: hypothetical protein IPN68_02085 [Bacteroidetes bacterium]|nr:hypothetical protein [Bacteroidota bacterium]